MGFSESEARLGLRACQGDITSAVDYITQKRQVRNVSSFLCLLTDASCYFLLLKLEKNADLMGY